MTLRSLSAAELAQMQPSGENGVPVVLQWTSSPGMQRKTSCSTACSKSEGQTRALTCGTKPTWTMMPVQGGLSASVVLRHGGGHSVHFRDYESPACEILCRLLRVHLVVYLYCNAPVPLRLSTDEFGEHERWRQEARVLRCLQGLLLLET